MNNRRLANRAMLEAMRAASAPITSDKVQYSIRTARYGSVRHVHSNGASPMTDWSDDDRELMNSALDALDEKLVIEMEAVRAALLFAPRSILDRALDGISGARVRLKHLKAAFRPPRTSRGMDVP